MADIDPDTHVQDMTITPISRLVPFAGQIITIALTVLFIIRYYVLERIVLPKCYGPIYHDLTEANKRGFLNHHIAGGAKLLILIVGVYPFVDVAFGAASLRTPFVGHSVVKMGDILVVCTQTFIAIYIFELIYRAKISPISIFHHLGTIVIGQAALSMSLNLRSEPDADIEFILCTVWGAFDIVCESLPHLSIILYRVYPTHHRFLYRLFLVAGITTFLGTLFETAVVMYVFASLWNRWKTAFKIVTPLLHIAFSATQMHGSHNFYRMMKRQQCFLQAEFEQETVVQEEGVHREQQQDSSVQAQLPMVEGKEPEISRETANDSSTVA